MPDRTFSIVRGFFAQDAPEAEAAAIGALPPRFGLLDDSPDCWHKFKNEIADLNRSAPEGTAYKVVFLGRHGQGHHNVAEEKYGTQKWDEHWSKLKGDEEIIWGPDPLLTPLGIAQAKAARDAWLIEKPNGIPLPERSYCSPLHRALDTWQNTFGEGDILHRLHQKATILENLREEYGVHTCDMRCPKSITQRHFPPPVYTFETGFTEDDTIWQAHERETESSRIARGAAVLEHIFGDEQATYISVTAHGGIINGILLASGRGKKYPLPTGGVLPLVIKAVLVDA